jgi:hypothetical protein
VIKQVTAPFGLFPYSSPWCFSAGKIYATDERERKFYAIDVTSGEYRVLQDSFPKPFDLNFYKAEAMTPSGNPLMLTIGPLTLSDTTNVFLLQPDNFTLSRLYSLKRPPGWSNYHILPEYFLSYDGQSLWVLYNYYNDVEGIQLFKYSGATGALEKEFPIDPRFQYVSGFVVTSNAIWINSTNSFDNRIYKLGRDGMEILETLRNPVFYSYGLSQDGNSFWTWDGRSTFIQFSVDGL